MLRFRIIPCILLSGQKVVKTTKFVKPVYIGDPINTVRIFSDKGADEIVILDIDATKKGQQPNYELIRRLSSEALMPLAYGGGIKDIDTVKKILSLGVEKVIINSGALSEPGLIEKISDKFGRSTLVVSIDIGKDIANNRYVYDHVSGKKVKKDPLAWIREVQKLGVGELFINCVYKDGTMAGYDFDFFSKVGECASVPVVACGGCGSIEDIRRIKGIKGIRAAAGGSFFVFNGLRKSVLLSYPTEEILNEINSVEVR